MLYSCIASLYCTYEVLLYPSKIYVLNSCIPSIIIPISYVALFSCTSQSTLQRSVSSSLFYRWENWCTGRWGDWPKIPQKWIQELNQGLEYQYGSLSTRLNCLPLAISYHRIQLVSVVFWGCYCEIAFSHQMHVMLVVFYQTVISWSNSCIWVQFSLGNYTACQLKYNHMIPWGMALVKVPT